VGPSQVDFYTYHLADYYLRKYSKVHKPGLIKAAKVRAVGKGLHQLNVK